MVEGLTLRQAPSAFPAVRAATVTLSFRRAPSRRPQTGAPGRYTGAAGPGVIRNRRGMEQW